ncbi:hypothetical protein HVTV-2_gp71 [Haloarcula virus HVTV-2]|uniref:Uncharacterized protein n=1 Tax=Haloarcula vallismortis tailed virus 1 TaxID=1262528 RepID=L7THX4_9CAUD|nr:hypothetical protein HVTV1_72 [Haloarcula vallismortis tailed virus 1]AGC34441.1 hypothetical protein HVTV1_72 [Haloarcula vallismortis tailed virus 1]UBF22878.1 hypothetical protein HVTV-2_gp71 [Haloarcula virus HVTV-2]
MATCLDCGAEFQKGESRGRTPMRYKGNYCEDCEEERRDDD